MKVTCKDVIKLSDDSGRGIALYNAFKIRPIRPNENVNPSRVGFTLRRPYLTIQKRFKRVSKFCRSLSRKRFRIIEHFDLGKNSENEYLDHFLTIPPNK